MRRGRRPQEREEREKGEEEEGEGGGGEEEVVRVKDLSVWTHFFSILSSKTSNAE